MAESYADMFMEIPSCRNSITIITDGRIRCIMSDSMLMTNKATSGPNAKPEEGATDKVESIDSDIVQLPAICDVEEQFSVLKEALEATSRAFRDLWDNYETLQRQNDALMTERDQLLVKNESSRIELEELRGNYSTAKQFIDRARMVEEENRQLVLELQHIKGNAGQSESLKEELRLLQASMADLETQLMASKKEKEELIERNRELTASDQSLNQSLYEAKGQMERMEGRCTQLDNALRDSIAERQKLETDRIRMGDEFQALKGEFEALKRDYGRMPKITF